MVSQSIQIVPVTTKKEKMDFIKFPWKIYRDDPYWVPPLIIDMKTMMNPKKCPFFLHSEAEFFLARRNGQTVGRVAAILNNRHIQVHKENLGFFGFFECIKDQSVANKLFDTVAEWARKKGLERLRGPANYSQNETCGLLVDGFDRSPVIMMTYNPPYYVDLVETYGFRKARAGATIRTINLKDFWGEVERVKKVYNTAWSPNWGFVPLTDEEIEHLAKELKPVLDPDIVFMAEVNGEPVGFSLAIPDFNQALKHVKNGRLFPFGLLKILWYKRKIDGVRVIIMGVIPQYQKRGIDNVFYLETYRRGVAKGYKWGEFSWILESNVMMNRAAQMMGAHIYKTYRMYEIAL
ncbi:MAG: N-acetyltransferase [candidate division KSB1 bacterium]|nr:N-acetyltransferase [candidate division KSB1 bacterium]